MRYSIKLSERENERERVIVQERELVMYIIKERERETERVIEKEMK